MKKKIVILSGSPKKNGNTSTLIRWFIEGVSSKHTETNVISLASLKYKSLGCTSCRVCQKTKVYECAVNDEAKPVLKKIAQSDCVVFATPLYFFGPSAQTKLIFDRMFSLYKWDNVANTMETPLQGKMLIVMASAFEDVGLKDLEKPFKITADYSGMKFLSLLIPNAGVSGDLENNDKLRKKTIMFGKKAGKVLSRLS